MAKNQLENFIENNRLDPVAAMNELQEAGIISDNCICAADVANCKEAVKWLIKPKNKN